MVIVLSLEVRLLLHDQLKWFDQPITNFIQSFESPLLTNIMKFFTWLGSSLVVISISFIVLISLYIKFKYRIELIFFVIALATSTILNQLLKNLFQRKRPTGHSLIEQLGFSFPSGHAMAAFTLYAIISFLLWKHIKTKQGRTIMIIFAASMIIMIGLSRIYLGVHYPSDVFGGYLVSGIWFSIMVYLYQLYLEKRYNHKVNTN